LWENQNYKENVLPQVSMAYTDKVAQTEGFPYRGYNRPRTLCRINPHLKSLHEYCRRIKIIKKMG
jgi:hypothetical protein